MAVDAAPVSLSEGAQWRRAIPSRRSLLVQSACRALTPRMDTPLGHDARRDRPDRRSTVPIGTRLTTTAEVALLSGRTWRYTPCNDVDRGTMSRYLRLEIVLAASASSCTKDVGSDRRCPSSGNQAHACPATRILPSRSLRQLQVARATAGCVPRPLAQRNGANSRLELRTQRWHATCKSSSRSSCSDVANTSLVSRYGCLLCPRVPDPGVLPSLPARCSPCRCSAARERRQSRIWLRLMAEVRAWSHLR